MSALLFSAPVIVYFAIDMQSVPRVMAQPSAAALPVSKPKRVLKTYNEEEKARAVQRVIAGEKKTRVADSIGVRESTLRGWVTMFQKEQRLPGAKKRNDKVATSLVTPEKTPEACESRVASLTLTLGEEATTSLTTPEKISRELDNRVEMLTPPLGEKTPIGLSAGDKRPNPVLRVLAPLTPPPSPKTEATRKSRGRPRTTSFLSDSQKKRIGEFSWANNSAIKRKRDERPGAAAQSLKILRSNGCRCSYRKVWAEERRLRDSIDLDAPEIVEQLDFFQSLGLMRRPVACNATPPPLLDK